MKQVGLWVRGWAPCAECLAQAGTDGVSGPLLCLYVSLVCKAAKNVAFLRGGASLTAEGRDIQFMLIGSCLSSAAGFILLGLQLTLLIIQLSFPSKL